MDLGKILFIDMHHSDHFLDTSVLWDVVLSVTDLAFFKINSFSVNFNQRNYENVVRVHLSTSKMITIVHN